MLKLRQITYLIVAFFVVFALSFPALPAYAASLTSLSDTLSTLAENTDANHTIQFTTPTGVVAGETITVTFDTDFDTASITEDDVDVEDDSVDLTTAADCSGSEEAGVSIAADVLTIEICTGDGGDIAASSVVTIEIGDNATASGTGSNQITNPASAESSQIDIAGTMADSGSLTVTSIADDSVAVSGQVDPTITFSISDTSIGFGDLSASTGRWATGDANGGDASDPATPTAAHTLSVATNADNGWAITYYGATLTSGSNTIDVASVDEDSDGTPGSEEFGISASTDGDSTVATGYLRDNAADFTFVASTTTTLISESAPTATETISVSYLANISGNTEAGDYSTAITYIATATF